MNRNIFLSFLLLGAISAGAQQLHTSSLYDMQGNFHNPAMAGANKYGSIGASYRTQWDGIPGGPQTATVFGSTYLSNAKIGIGGYLYSDKTGPTKRTGIQTSYAYHIPFKNGGSFSIGLEARGQQFSYDKAKLQQSLGNNDPVLASAENRFKFDAGFGLAYTGKKLQLGASVSQIIQSKLDFYTGNLNTTEQGRLYRHYYLHGNYKWDVDGTTTIVPNFLVIYLPNAPTELQAGARVIHNNVFWWGLSLRTRQSWMLSAGVHIKKKFTLGYSFDIYNTPLSVYDAGANAHEVILRYDFLK
jgi:type IX secretion system PorP/SprF family membrane protein